MWTPPQPSCAALGPVFPRDRTLTHLCRTIRVIKSVIEAGGLLVLLGRAAAAAVGRRVAVRLGECQL